MQGSSVRRCAVAVVLGVLCTVPGSPVQGATLEELRACAESNVPTASSALLIELISRDEADRETVHVGKVFWKTDGKDRWTLVCMEEPKSVEGLAYLIREGESGPALWGYLPEEDRVWRVELVNGGALRTVHFRPFMTEAAAAVALGQGRSFPDADRTRGELPDHRGPVVHL